MCVTGPWYPSRHIVYYVDGIVKRVVVGDHDNLNIQPGSVLRIGILSGNSTDEVIGELSQLNIWDKNKLPSQVRMMSRGCSGPMGNVIPWSVVQFWLHDNVTKTSPTSCTSTGIYS